MTTDRIEADAAKFVRRATRDGIDISAEITLAHAAAMTASKDPEHAFYWTLVNALRTRSGLKTHQQADMAIRTSDVGRDHALDELDRVLGH